MSQQRIIALVDCDCFFVSCEQVDNPDLRGKAVCVTTGAGERGIVVSRSPKAKALGIKMGEPLFKLHKRGIEAVFIPARHHRYSEISAQVMQVLQNFSPDVEQVSVDEAYVDLTSLNKVYKKTYTEIIKDIRQQVWKQVEVPVSIGLSTSKTLAKLASDKAKKNNGIFAIPPHKILQIIGNSPIEEVCGVGRQNLKHLQYYGIFTIKDYVEQADAFVRKSLGINGLNLKYELLGSCTSKVNNKPQAPKSIQNTAMLGNFTQDEAMLRAALLGHIHHACRKLRKWNGFCRTAGVMLRTKDFRVMSARQKLPICTNSETEIAKTALQLLHNIYRPHEIYRSCGISLEEVDYDYQPSLFETSAPEQQDSKLSHALDELEAKFGQDIVKTGWI